MNNLLSSLNKNKNGIILILVSSIFTTMGQYFWKISNLHVIQYIFIGFLLYGIGAVSMIIAFKFGSFSVLHPMMSAGYILTILVGFYLLNEAISTFKIIGLILIMAGIVLIGVGDE